MRTTLTLDDDIAAKLKAEVRRTGNPFKQVVNEMLRRAINTPPPASPQKPFPILVRDLGLRSGLSLDNIGELLEQIEGPLYK
ncbi:MAG: ribbon-helix-helix domain-containing protein [Terriglobales bacterium]